MRHTFATWSLAAGMSIFTLARRMGTSAQMIDATYGHLARDAEDQDRELLNVYDNANRHVVGAELAGDEPLERSLAREKPCGCRACSEARPKVQLSRHAVPCAVS